MSTDMVRLRVFGGRRLAERGEMAPSEARGGNGMVLRQSWNGGKFKYEIFCVAAPSFFAESLQVWKAELIKLTIFAKNGLF